LLGGDEMGRTQAATTNAYCQTTRISWFDWKLDERRRRLFDFTRQLITLRRRHPVLQRGAFSRRLHLGIGLQRLGVVAARRRRDEPARLAKGLDLQLVSCSG